MHRYTIKIYGSLNAYDEIISWIAEPMGGRVVVVFAAAATASASASAALASAAAVATT